MLPNIGQTKSKKKIKWFENPEIDEEPLLTFNRRTHSHVSDIEYYEELISKSYSKVGCVFAMVVVPILSHVKWQKF